MNNRERTLKKKIYERASGGCGAITKYPTFVSLDPPEGKEKVNGGKNVQKINS